MTSIAKKPDGKDDTIQIRCSHQTKVNFKKIAAEFDDYEHLVAWLVSNFEDFRALRAIPPRDQLLIKRGIL